MPLGWLAGFGLDAAPGASAGAPGCRRSARRAASRARTPRLRGSRGCRLQTGQRQLRFAVVWNSSTSIRPWRDRADGNHDRRAPHGAAHPVRSMLRPVPQLSRRRMSRRVSVPVRRRGPLSRLHNLRRESVWSAHIEIAPGDVRNGMTQPLSVQRGAAPRADDLVQPSRRGAAPARLPRRGARGPQRWTRVAGPPRRCRPAGPPAGRALG